MNPKCTKQYTTKQEIVKNKQNNPPNQNNTEYKTSNTKPRD